MGLSDEERVYRVSERLGGVIHRIFVSGKVPKVEKNPVRRRMDWMFPTKDHITLTAGTRWSRLEGSGWTVLGVYVNSLFPGWKPLERKDRL